MKRIQNNEMKENYYNLKDNYFNNNKHLLLSF